mgnify:CR=1 FL=1
MAEERKPEEENIKRNLRKDVNLKENLKENLNVDVEVLELVEDPGKYFILQLIFYFKLFSMIINHRHVTNRYERIIR